MLLLYNVVQQKYILTISPCAVSVSAEFFATVLRKRSKVHSVSPFGRGSKATSN